MTKRSAAASAVAGLLAGFGFTGSAGAAALANCPASFTADGTAKVFVGTPAISAVTACQYVTPPDPGNVASAANVNAAGFFGFGDWAATSVNQWDGLRYSGSSGGWTILGGVDFAKFDYMITFKDGQHTNLISFLFDEAVLIKQGAIGGGWNTPFTDPPFDFPGGTTAKDVSHVSIFFRSGSNNQVPEPGTLALLSACALGVGLLRRRRTP